jgi:hypothetical protein
MSENVPPPNGPNAPGYAVTEREPLGNANGNTKIRVETVPSAVGKKIKKLEVDLSEELKKSRSLTKDLAQAQSKHKKLLELLDTRGLELVQARSDKTGAVAEVNLLKKLHKSELKAEKELAKKELTSKIAIVKGLESTKRTASRDLEKLKKQHETLAKQHASLVGSHSDLNFTLVGVLNAKTQLVASGKSQARDIKRLSKLIDNQQEKKLSHEIEIASMRVKVKELALEETRERISNPSGPSSKTPKNPTLALDDRKALATHNAQLKKASKESDDARAASKKESKKKAMQESLGFAAGLMQTTSNMNGGMWQATSVAEVSFFLL